MGISKVAWWCDKITSMIFTYLLSHYHEIFECIEKQVVRAYDSDFFQYHFTIILSFVFIEIVSLFYKVYSLLLAAYKEKSHYIRVYTVSTPGCKHCIHPGAKQTRMGVYGNFYT